MRSSRWALTQYDWFPYKKEKFALRDVHAQREVVKTGRVPGKKGGHPRSHAYASGPA